jgi:hypothetical protein
VARPAEGLESLEPIERLLAILVIAGILLIQVPLIL